MDRIEQERNFWIVGGDLRHRALARLLREEGHTVHQAAIEGEGLTPEPLGPGLKLAHCVILPLPVTGRDGLLHAPLSRVPVPLEAVLDRVEPGQLLCGGLVSPEVSRAARDRGLRLEDYYAREECKVANAVPTAVTNGPTGRTQETEGPRMDSGPPNRTGPAPHLGSGSVSVSGGIVRDGRPGGRASPSTQGTGTHSVTSTR